MLATIYRLKNGRELSATRMNWNSFFGTYVLWRSLLKNTNFVPKYKEALDHEKVGWCRPGQS